MRFLYQKENVKAFLLLFILLFTYQLQAQRQNNKEGKTYHGMRVTRKYLEQMKDLRDSSMDSDASVFGAWKSVIPDKQGAAIGRILSMQTVHSVLLPSGKILMSSGSSWRNFKNIETYPQYKDPVTAMGLFNLYDDPFRNTHTFNLKDGTQSKNYRKEFYYNLVNNTAIYDPLDSSFYRIPHPVPQNDTEDSTRFEASDLFCSGHIQLADGNALFIGGTQYYFPYRTGNKGTFIFDWQQEMSIDWKGFDWRIMPKTDSPYYPWKFSGFMKRGRWYPSMVPLPDGRQVLFSGFVGFEKGYPKMYRFEINHYVEFFDPYRFSLDNPQKAWTSVDVKAKKNSPFSTKLQYTFNATKCTDTEFHSYWEAKSFENHFPLPCECDSNCQKDNQYDAFKLYPNNYLLTDNKIFLSREGDWVSLRTSDAAYMRKTKNTYFMNIEGTTDQPDVSFEKGPDRQREITSYGTSYIDPNTRNITIMGGQPTSTGTLLPIDSKSPTQFAGGRGSRKREQFWFNKDIAEKESWTLTPDFLGNQPEDDRTMLAAIILPTKQVLLVNGGNYDFYGPVHSPLLLTPKYDAQERFVDYTKTKMSAAVEPRLYHNAALLLPNGTIWVSGGNSARASVSETPVPATDQNRKGQPKPNLDQVDIDMYFYRDGQMAKAQKGMNVTPTENWTAEIFSPPYMFIDPARTMKIEKLKAYRWKPKYELKKSLEGKDFYLLKSNREYKIDISNTPADSKQIAKAVMIKLPSFTHNWDSGQHFIDLKVTDQTENSLCFETPDMKNKNIPPGYYMLFYLDSKGKPSVSQMVRFDDKANSPLDSFLK